jgi:hypothetical protein
VVARGYAVLGNFCRLKDKFPPPYFTLKANPAGRGLQNFLLKKGEIVIK